MISYVNIHTHCGGGGVNILDVGECYADLKAELEKSRSGGTEFFYSAGWHPMKELTRKREEILEELKRMIALKEVVAMGECGLDRRSTVLFSEQIPLLLGQVELAECVQKPLIIHCVKAYSDLIRIHKGVKTTIPWIIHGFNNNEQILNQLLEHGFYISVGPQVLNPYSNIFRLLRKIPLYALFLESDDREIRIETIYEAAASVLGIGEEELKRVIWDNYQRVIKI